jgi:signal transduction histidine kinase
MGLALNTVDTLEQENQRLLLELEFAYKNLEQVLEQTTKEKEIAYKELQENFDELQTSYKEISKKENLLVHLEKLSSIGQFITEIIHELKNPLTIISAHTEMALMMDPTEEMQEQLKQVSTQVMRMSGYLNRFRSMAYKGQEDFVTFDLNNNLYDCLSTIEIINPKGVRIETDFCQDLLPIKGDPYQTNQIFLNLAKNAFDAIKGHGNLLTVKSRMVTCDSIRNDAIIGDHYCLSKNKWEKILNQTEKFALIEFEDDGSGIPEENLGNLFQAFFTTKGREKGTGLGMSISSDIAKRHGGNIAVCSEIEKGTVFQLLFPILEQEEDYDFEL